MDSSDGEPAPTAPTLALVTIAGNVTAGAHRVLWTYVTADGETDAGVASSAVTADVTHAQIDSTVPIGGSAVTARRAYMTLAGGATFYLVATVADNTTTTYRINTADGSLGVQAPTTNTTADPELVNWIAAARQVCETITKRALITQTWDWKFDEFPFSVWDALLVPKPPTQSITSIAYIDMGGVTQTWSASLYDTELPTGPQASPARVQPAFQQIYPVTRLVPAAVTLRFVAGYGAASAVPAAIKSAMKLLIGNWWVNREAAALVRANVDVLPYGVEALLWPFKTFT